MEGEEELVLVRLKSNGELHNAFRHMGGKTRYCDPCGGRPLMVYEYYTCHLKPDPRTKTPLRYYACGSCYAFEPVGLGERVPTEMQETQQFPLPTETDVEIRAAQRKQATEPIKLRFLELMERLKTHG